MMKTTNRIGAVLLTAVLATGLAAFADTNTAGRYDTAIQAGVVHELQKKSDFRDVRSSVQDGIVTLEGSVSNYEAKLKADKAARKADHVAGVRNLVAVSAPEVSDAQLQDQIAKKLRFEGYSTGTHVFNVFEVGVKDGTVTVAGEAYSPYDKQQALEDVARTRGVKDVVDLVKVSPAAMFDDDIRMRLVRTIYGGSGLKYGIDPVAPIRIVVDNGHVGLYGVVDSNIDRTMALMRARQVFGVFDVQNHLVTSRELAR